MKSLKCISLLLATLTVILACWMPISATEEGETVECTINGAAITLNNDIDLVVEATVPIETDDVYMLFAVENKPAIPLKKGVKQGDSAKYVFTYTGLLPQNMTDDIRMDLRVDGVTVATKHYSVQEYCLNKLNDEASSAELKTLVTALLHYGAAAQSYCGYQTGELANASLIAPVYDFSAIANEITQTVTTEGNDIWTSASVLLESQLSLKVVTVKKNDNAFYVCQNGDSLADSCAADENGVICYERISPAELDTDIVFVYSGYSNPCKVSVSVNACIKSLLNDTSVSESTKTLTAALYQYGVAAKAYVE